MSDSEKEVEVNSQAPTKSKRGRPRKYATNEETIRITRERENKRRLDRTVFKNELKTKHSK